MFTSLPSKPKLSHTVAKRSRLAIITSDYNGKLTALLEKYCRQTLQNNGVPKNYITAIHVPGALEIPVVAKTLATSKCYDAIIALGMVLKGETYHFEIVADQCAAGLQAVAIETGIPVINEVLACYTTEQAEARAGDHANNKGVEAAVTALKMIVIMKSLPNPSHA